MNNQKPMVKETAFRQNVAKLSRQHFLSTMVKSMSLDCGPEPASTESPVQFTESQDIARGPSMSMAIPWRSSPRQQWFLSHIKDKLEKSSLELKTDMFMRGR